MTRPTGDVKVRTRREGRKLTTEVEFLSSSLKWVGYRISGFVLRGPVVLNQNNFSTVQGNGTTLIPLVRRTDSTSLPRKGLQSRVRGTFGPETYGSSWVPVVLLVTLSTSRLLSCDPTSVPVVQLWVGVKGLRMCLREEVGRPSWSRVGCPLSVPRKVGRRLRHGGCGEDPESFPRPPRSRYRPRLSRRGRDSPGCPCGSDPRRTR